MPETGRSGGRQARDAEGVAQLCCVSLRGRSLAVIRGPPFRVQRLREAHWARSSPASTATTTSPASTCTTTDAAHRSAGAPRRQPPPAGRDEDQRVPLAPHEPEPVRPRRTGPQLDPSAAERRQRTRAIVDHQADLGDRAQLTRIERARSPRCAQLRMRDQLDDVAGGVERVAGERVPVVELERRLAAARLGEQRREARQPGTRCLKPTPGHEQREVVKRPTRDRQKRDPPGPEPHREPAAGLLDQVSPSGIERPQRVQRISPDGQHRTPDHELA